MTNINTAKMIEALKSQIAKIEADLAKAPQHANGEAQAQLETALHARGGHATVAELMHDCGMTKGTCWRHINALEREAKVWLRVTHRTDGRKHTIVYRADAIAC
jgi:response regulator of citrate/malate metabolism